MSDFRARACRPLVFVCLFIAACSWFGLRPLLEEGESFTLRGSVHAATSSHGQPRKRRPVDRTGSALLVESPEIRARTTTLVLRLSSIDSLTPRTGRARISIATPEGTSSAFERLVDITGGEARFSDIPIGQTYRAEIAATQSFPCIMDVEGPAERGDVVTYEVPLVERRVTALLRGEDDRLLDFEWVVVDLFAGRPGYQQRVRLPVMRISSDGKLRLTLHHPPEGEYALRVMQDEGKVMAGMTRAWAALPDEGATVDFGTLKLTPPPFFASGTTIRGDGRPLARVKLDVLNQEGGSDWFFNSSASTRSDYRGRWRLCAEYRHDLLQILPTFRGRAPREDYFIPRGARNITIQMPRQAE